MYPPGGFASPAPYPQWSPPAAAPAGSPAPAYIAAAVFATCAVLSYLVAGMGWTGTEGNLNALAAMIGMAFSADVTGNGDFGVALTMTVASTVLCGALVLALRWNPVRWILAAVGALVAVYYGYAFIYLLTNNVLHYATGPVLIVVVALLLWTAATVLVLLPHTAAAMRRRSAPVGRR